MVAYVVGVSAQQQKEAATLNQNASGTIGMYIRKYTM